MNHKLTAIAAVALTAVAAQAETALTVHEADGAETTIDGGKVTRITIADGQMVLWNGTEAYTTFGEGNEVVRLTFGANSGLHSVLAQAAKVGVRGPVTHVLSLYGIAADAKPCALQVVAANGAVCLKVADWRGQDVNVAQLPAGIYVANFNNHSIKFVKQ